MIKYLAIGLTALIWAITAVPVQAQTDLAVTKTAPGSVTAGRNLTYSLTVEIKGAKGADNVVLSDPLPAGTTFVSATQKTGPAFTLKTPAVGGRGTVEATADLADLNLDFVADPMHLAVCGDTVYFSATSSKGRELWKSNGTPLGTKLVKDINLNGDSSPRGFIEINGTVFFSANDGVHGNELWKTDGTLEGTVMVKDISSGNSDSFPGGFTVVNDTLFFGAGTYAPGGCGGFGCASNSELWKSDGTAQGTVLVKDINPGIGDSSPSYLTNVNGTLFFAARNGHPGSYDQHGVELWKSDGTAEGTVMVKDINMGSESSNPVHFTNVNGTLFFQADNGSYGWAGTHGIELWKSNGTPEGTTLVKDINVGYAASMPNDFTNVNGTLFFTANNGTHGRELWKSDGTRAGTVLVKDIYAGSSSSASVFDYQSSFLTNVNGTLFFQADDGTNGRELWKSDGTSQGTVLVTDINPGYAGAFILYGHPYYSPPYRPVHVNGMLFFMADNGTNGIELWKSNGTPAGTTLVKDINAGSGNANAQYLTNFNGTLLFSADNGINGPVLWRSNGSTQGTVPLQGVENANRATFEIVVKVIDSFAGPLSNTATVASNETDSNTGNNTATVTTNVIAQVTDLAVTKTAPISVKAGRNLTYSLAVETSSLNAAYNVALSDPLPTGTTFVSATQKSGPTFSLTTPPVGQRGTVRASVASLSGLNQVIPHSSMQLGATLLYLTNNSSNGVELWKTDGTAQGTVLLKEINPGSVTSFPHFAGQVNNRLLFVADDGINGNELWRTDGTPEGTVLVENIRPGASGSNPSIFTVVDGTLFFRADDGAHGVELWKSDGTAQGTQMVKDITVNGVTQAIQDLTNVNGILFFSANFQLWKSDGTEAGTVLVKDVSPYNLAVFNGILYFNVHQQATGTELWKSDGTPQGTVLFKDINPGAGSGGAAGFVEVNGTAFLKANNGTHGSELWKTNGTPQGTVMVKDINPGANGSELYWLKSANGTLFFIANDGTHGYELWKSDGTPEGTVMVKDINPGSGVGTFSYLLEMNGTWFFGANDGVNGYELWKTDGTLQGTEMVKDIVPGSDSSNPTPLAVINDTLFFWTRASMDGLQLWKTDGTAIGTVPVYSATPNSRATFEIVVKVDEDATGTLSNTASVTSRTPDADTTNNSATASTTVTPLPSVSLADISVTEGPVAGAPVDSTVNATFTVRLSHVWDNNVTVNYATANGSAVNGSDYIAQSGTLTFLPGQTSQTVTVPVKGDVLDEDNETFFLNLSTPIGAILGDAQGVNTIRDDDALPLLSIADIALTEGTASVPTKATFTVTLSTVSGRTVGITAVTADGTARTPGDYSAARANLSFAPGETSKAFTVDVKADSLDEATEVFYALLSSPFNAGVARGRSMATITDDDAPPSITIEDLSIGEGNSGQRVASFRLHLSASSGQPVKVNYATAAGTVSPATPGNDYVAVTPAEIAFTTGQTVALARVFINGDTLNEPNETLLVNLSNPVNATIADSQALGTILNDDTAPSLTINDATVTEGDSGTKLLTFTVALSKPDGQTISVNYVSANGTAQAGSDYIAKSGTLTFAPGGAAMQTISVVINGDTAVEGNETLVMLLSDAVNASIGRARGVGTITNDDSSG